MIKPSLKNLIDSIEDTIDVFLQKVSPDVKWTRLSNRLGDLLLLNITDAQKEAIKDMNNFLTSGYGDINEKEILELLDRLEPILGRPMSEKIRDDVKAYQVKAYTGAQVELGLQLEYNKTDLRALSWLEKDMMYWIGSNYDRETRDKLLSTAKDILAQGYTREQAADLLKEQFKDQFKKSRDYWTSLSNHIITRAREFGHTEGYVKAKVNSFKVVAVLDMRTSNICKYMNGRIIKVSDAVEQRDKLMKTTDPEEVKKLAPWLSDKKADSSLLGAKTSYVVGKLKLVLPPYHYNCRSRTVIAYDSEQEDYVKEAVEKVVKREL